MLISLGQRSCFFHRITVNRENDTFPRHPVAVGGSARSETVLSHPQSPRNKAEEEAEMMEKEDKWLRLCSRKGSLLQGPMRPELGYSVEKEKFTRERWPQFLSKNFNHKTYMSRLPVPEQTPILLILFSLFCPLSTSRILLVTVLNKLISIVSFYNFVITCSNHVKNNFL